jgi:fructokinase
MAKILCIGEALIDMICTDKGTTLQHGNYFLKKAGGAPTNVAAAIAALGGNVTLAAKVGNDPFGLHLKEVLQSFGVNCSNVLTSNDAFTTFAFVSLMENGERDFYFNRGADAQLSVSDIQQLHFNDYSIVHFGSATGFLPGPLQAAYTYALDAAIAAGCFISFDPNYRSLLFGKQQEVFIEKSWHYLRKCNFFKVSEEEAMLLTNTQNVDAAATLLLEQTQAVFAVTLGKDGTLLGMNGTTHTIPSIKIQPVDTTGAGDAFGGAVLYQLSQLHGSQIQDLTITQWQHIVSNANKAGARTCEYLGAMEAFKHLNNSILQ